MNRFIKLSVFICLLIFAAGACSEDDSPTSENPDPNLIAVNSELGNLLLLTTDINNTSAIDCMDFIYPITVFIYNSNQQQTGSQTVNSDSELLALLQSLETGTYIALQFPLSVVLQDGTVVEVTTNAELIALISGCSANGGGVPSNFEAILTSGSWFVTYFFDDIDETTDFAGYEFTFDPDNTAQAVSATNTVGGTWNLTTSTTPDLSLFFGNTDPFNELDEDWDIIEATQDIIRLKHISGGDGSVDFLTFERNPNGGGGGNTSDFTNVLTTGVWYVNLLDDNGIDETCNYVDYQFSFNGNQTVVATSSNNTVNGTWAVTATNNDIDLTLNFEITGGNDPFEDLNDNWDLISFDAQLIKLTDVSGGNGGTDYLDFGRNPHTGCGGGGGNTSDFTDILTTGIWYVNLFDDDGIDETCNYVDYQFSFNANQTVVATSANNTVNGTWAATATNNEIDLILNFEITGGNDPFEDLNDNWDLISFNAQLLQLTDVSGGNGGINYLNFGRNPYTGCGGGGGNTTELTNIFIDGQWFVESYIDDGDDQTIDYNGYTLTFNANGSVVAVNGGTTINGTWGVMEDGNELQVMLNFGTAVPFDEFNDDWDVLAYTTTRVQLFDVSGGNGGTDYLTFQKL